MVQPPNLLCSHLITVNRPIQAALTHKAWAHKAGGQWGGNNNEGGHTFPVIFSPQLCVRMCVTIKVDHREDYREPHRKFRI